MRIKPAKGWPAASDAMRDASTVFELGDKATVRGCAVVVVERYGLHKVMNDEGEYCDEDRKRFDYCQGYVIQYRNGETFFVHAWQLSDSEDVPTHLRLVGSASARTTRPMMALGV